MPPDRGLFLDQTWRLHPDICAFTSEMYYEDRLSGRGFGRVVLAGATQGPAGVAGADGARHALEDRLRVPVEAAAFSDLATLSDRSPGSSQLLDDLAPMVGILARDSAA